MTALRSYQGPIGRGRPAVALGYDAPARPYTAARRPVPARTGVFEEIIQRCEPLFVLYVIAASSGALGFIDILVTGNAYIRDDASLFAKIQWPVLYLATVALAWIHARQVGTAARAAWPILIWPVVAWLSVAWSVDPGTTAGQALRFSVTVLIGILLGARYPVDRLAQMVFYVVLAGVGASVLLALAQVPLSIAPGGEARGIYFHKNMLGGQAILLFAVSAILVMSGWRIPLSLIGCTVALMGVGLSGSATAAATTAVLAVGLPMLAALALRPLAAITVVLCAVFFAGLVAVAFAHLGTDPYTEALRLLDRDPTMTGRSDLWAAGIAQFWDRPILGAGFGAFWTGALDWRTQLVLNELGDVGHFHNTFLEVGVQLGFLGLGAFVLVLLLILASGVSELLARRRMILIWPPALWVLAMVSGMAEIVLFNKHALFQILMCAVFVQVLLLRRTRRIGNGGGR